MDDVETQSTRFRSNANYAKNLFAGNATIDSARHAEAVFIASRSSPMTSESTKTCVPVAITIAEAKPTIGVFHSDTSL